MKALVVAAIIAAGISTATPAAAAPRPPAGNPCVVAIRAVFKPYGAAVVNRFVAISYRESRWTQTVKNPRSSAAGCLQVLAGVARNVGARCSQLDAWCSATTSRTLYRRFGFRPWAVR